MNTQPGIDATMQRAVQRDAASSVLLGVDFLPSYRRELRLGAQAPSSQLVEVLPADPRREANRAKLEAVRARYEADAPHKAFGFTFTNLVFGEGDPAAGLMFVGEAPGADEDKTGRPFVGRAGQLLDKMIVAMGLTRQQVYIANVLKVRPPNNATPSIAERDASKPYLFDQIAAVMPRVIVTLGLPASQVLLNSDESMGRLRSVWHEFAHPRDPACRVPVMPTYHPAYLLRSYTDANRKAVWSDLKKALERLRAGQ